MSDILEPKTNEETVSVQAETEAAESVSTEGTQPVNAEEATPVSDGVSEPVNAEEAMPGNSETVVPVDADGIQPKKKSKKPLIFILSGVAAVGIIVGIILIIVLNAKSEEAKRVDDMISSIGTVTLDSEDKIAEAEKAVKALAEEDRNQLDNVGELENARKTYEELSAKAESKRIVKLIDEIGEVTTNSERSITAARNAYNEADDTVRKMVTNYDKLTAAEEKYNKAVDAAYASQAEKVIKLINDIGKVTADSESKIKKAEDAYKSLPTQAQSKVTNYSTLTEARSQLTKAKKEAAKGEKASLKEKMMTAFSKLTKKYDDVTGYTWYYGSTQPNYVNERTYVLPYLSIKGSLDDAAPVVNLHLRTVYYGDDWVFYDKLIINADGQRYTIDCSYDVDRDNEGGMVWEVYNKQIRADAANAIMAIGESSSATVRFSGKYSYDFNVPSSDKQAINEVMEAFKAWSIYTQYDG